MFATVFLNYIIAENTDINFKIIIDTNAVEQSSMWQDHGIQDANKGQWLNWPH